MSIGIETAAGEMAVGKTPCSTAIYLALMRTGVETPVGGMAVGKRLRSTANYLALMSARVETPAGGMAISNTPPSRGSGERWDRDGGWRDGCWQEATQ